MRTLSAFLGVFLVGTVLVDALWTTVAASGGGPLTTRLARSLWSLALARHRRSSTHRLLAIMGPVILISAIALWIAMLWAGYALVFSAAYGAVVKTSTHVPAGFWERVYFTGFTISTLGTGDYVPHGDGWRFLSVIASLNGLFLVTLSITYLVPVLSAVAAKRQLAALIADVGTTPGAILERAWNEAGDFVLDDILTQLAPMIELHAQRHLAYPVLHFFHSRHARTAAAPRLAALDEALLAISAEARRRGIPPPVSVRVARRAIGSILTTLDTAFIHKSKVAPPLSRAERSRTEGGDGMPEALEEAAAETEMRRRLLLAFVRDDGWTWDDVVGADGDAEDRTVFFS